MARRATDFIAIHCSATPPNQDIGVNELRDLHVGVNGWRDVGYHLVIRRNGTIEKGRDLDAIGAHIKGFNDVSLGICLIGGVDGGGEPQNNFTQVQMMALKAAVEICTGLYPDAQVQGHRDFPGVNKACPCFDAGGWWDGVKEWAQC